MIIMIIIVMMMLRIRGFYAPYCNTTGLLKGPPQIPRNRQRHKRLVTALWVLRLHLRVEDALQRGLHEDEVLPAHAGRVHDDHGVPAAAVGLDHRLLHLHHEALDLVEGLVVVREHDVDVILLGHVPVQQGLASCD